MMPLGEHELLVELDYYHSAGWVVFALPADVAEGLVGEVATQQTALAFSGRLKEKLDRLEMSSERYPKAESVSIDLRMNALEVVLAWVRLHYGSDAIALRNVAALVDGVADAVVKNDHTSALVRGMRLLTQEQTFDLWHRLGGK